MKMLKNWACLAISVGVCSAPVFAQDMRSASEKVVACQDVSDSLERLACYEAAASELSAVLAAPVPEIVAAQSHRLPRLRPQSKPLSLRQ
jgi:hypothetical protein